MEPEGAVSWWEVADCDYTALCQHLFLIMLTLSMLQFSVNLVHICAIFVPVVLRGLMCVFKTFTGCNIVCAFEICNVCD